MENPSIVMSIDEGPKKGETLDSSAGSVIHIGRVIRGNTLAIKDPGISQKHLTVAFHREISRWVVTDLGTSNGTAVNSAVISPNAPFPLTDGDIITIGNKTSISVKISAPNLAPQPRTRRGRRLVAAAGTSPMEEEKVVEPEKHAGKGNSYSASGSVKQENVVVKENTDELNENHQKGRAQRKRSIASTGASRNNKALEPAVAEGDNKSTEISAGVLKAKGEERGVVHENVEGPTRNEGRGRIRVRSFVDPTTILTKGSPLEPVVEKRKTRKAVKALSMPKDDDEGLEKIDMLVKDGRKGPARTKRGGSARISFKDEALEPVVVPLRPGRVTRASTLIKGEEKETKVENVQVATTNNVKHTQVSKKSGRSTRISRKREVSELVEIEEKIVGSLCSHVEVTATIQMNNVIVEPGKKKKKAKVKDNPPRDGKMLAESREVSFVVEETDNHKDAIMSEESNRSRDFDFPDKKELVYSWSSFSEIRGIPNTTSKYREDRMINCHATPFEARVERALNKGITETSSSVEIEETRSACNK